MRFEQGQVDLPTIVYDEASSRLKTIFFLEESVNDQMLPVSPFPRGWNFSILGLRVWVQSRCYLVRLSCLPSSFFSSVFFFVLSGVC